MPGARTAYLAGDPAVALAEYARHAAPPERGETRRIVRLRLAGIVALDLRSRDVGDALGIVDPAALLDRGTARELALAIRSAALCQAIVVPSMAFIDRADRWNVVVFCECVAGGLAAVLGEPRTVGQVRLRG